MSNPPEDNPDCFWGEVPVDQWTYCEKVRALGTAEALKMGESEESAAEAGDAALLERLRRHWDTWVTQEDLQTLAAAGVTHLRVPFGFWILGDVDIADGEPCVCRLVPSCHPVASMHASTAPPRLPYAGGCSPSALATLS